MSLMSSRLRGRSLEAGYWTDLCIKVRPSQGAMIIGLVRMYHYFICWMDA